MFWDMYDIFNNWSSCQTQWLHCTWGGCQAESCLTSNDTMALSLCSGKARDLPQGGHSEELFNTIRLHEVQLVYLWPTTDHICSLCLGDRGKMFYNKGFYISIGSNKVWIRLGSVQQIWAAYPLQIQSEQLKSHEDVCSILDENNC